MNIHHEPEVTELHFRKRLVSQDAGVVDQYIYPPPAFDGIGNHGLDVGIIRHVGAIGDRIAASLADCLCNLLRRIQRRAASVARTAKIVYDHACPATPELQGVTSTQAVSRTRNNNDLFVKPDCHIYSSLSPTRWSRPTGQLRRKGRQVYRV